MGATAAGRLVAMLAAACALTARAGLCADDGKEEKPAQTMISTQTMPMSTERAFGAYPSSIRVMPLSTDRIITRNLSSTTVLSTDPGVTNVAGGAVLRSGWSEGGLCWKDERGRKHCIVPSNPCDRWLLQHGFVPNNVLYLYYKYHHKTGDIIIPLQIPVQTSPDVNVYNYVIVPQTEPPLKAQEEVVDVLEPTAPEPTAPEPGQTTFASRLWAALGGKGNVNESFAVGESFLKRGDLERAANSFRRAASREPDSPVILLALGIAYLGEGELASAVQNLRQGLSLHPDPNQINVELRNLMGGDGAYRERVVSLLAKLRENPDDRAARFLLGFIYFADSDWPRAAVQFKEAETLDPTDPIAARMRALTLGRMTNVGSAVEQE